jgi:hypothetical protein
MANFSLVQPDFLKYYLIPLEFSLQLQIDSLKRIYPLTIYLLEKVDKRGNSI